MWDDSDSASKIRINIDLHIIRILYSRFIAYKSSRIKLKIKSSVELNIISLVELTFLCLVAKHPFPGRIEGIPRETIYSGYCTVQRDTFKPRLMVNIICIWIQNIWSLLVSILDYIKFRAKCNYSSLVSNQYALALCSNLAGAAPKWRWAQGI